MNIIPRLLQVDLLPPLHAFLLRLLFFVSLLLLYRCRFLLTRTLRTFSRCLISSLKEIIYYHPLSFCSMVYKK
jgi:hypothetical protein